MKSASARAGSEGRWNWLFCMYTSSRCTYRILGSHRTADTLLVCDGKWKRSLRVDASGWDGDGGTGWTPDGSARWGEGDDTGTGGLLYRVHPAHILARPRPSHMNPIAASAWGLCTRLRGFYAATGSCAPQPLAGERVVLVEYCWSTARVRGTVTHPDATTTQKRADRPCIGG